VLLQDAYERAQRFLTEQVRPEHKLEIVIARCIETDAGWEFSYNTREFLEQGSIRDSLAGNGPIVVPRTGESPFVGPVLRRRD
jgi:hypothetical protein